ncbi:MAG TPA: ABC transporter ATP-binding protein [Rhodanobacter sp.]|nr:ABC transporter ATP-binding protein [Rhodanobacter sp.]
MTALIELRDISRVFRTDSVETHAVRNVSLSIDEGEFIALTGVSGCGKSSLLNILGLLDSPTSGTHTLSGSNVEHLSFDQRAHIRNRSIGFVFQSFQLIPELSVLDNVKLPLRYASSVPASPDQRAMELLHKVGIDHRSGHRPSQLSGGQQQRVAIARALYMSPELLLLDEPTGNLDVASSTLIMDIIGDLHQGGATVVLVTHEPAFAERAGRIVRLVDGQIEAAG